MVTRLRFRKAWEIVGSGSDAKAGIDPVASQFRPQPIRRNGPASRQVIDVQKHVGGQIARRSVANDGPVKKRRAQASLGRENISDHITG